MHVSARGQSRTRLQTRECACAQRRTCCRDIPSLACSPPYPRTCVPLPRSACTCRTTALGVSLLSNAPQHADQAMPGDTVPSAYQCCWSCSIPTTECFTNPIYNSTPPQFCTPLKSRKKWLYCSRLVASVSGRRHIYVAIQPKMPCGLYASRRITNASHNTGRSTAQHSAVPKKSEKNCICYC